MSATNALAPIVVRERIRNGQSPTAALQVALATHINYAVQTRLSVHFSRASQVTNVPPSNSTAARRSRWRFSFNTGPVARALAVSMQLAPQSNFGTPTSPYCILEIAKLADVTALGFNAAVCGIATVAWGSSDGTYPDTLINMGPGPGSSYCLIPGTSTFEAYAMEPDTMYCARFSDVAYGRLVSACAWEVPLDSSPLYPVATLASGSPIVETDRQMIADLHRKLWARGAQSLWCHASETDALAPVATAGYAMSLGIATSPDTATALSGTLTHTISVVVANGTQSSLSVLVDFAHNGTYTPSNTGLAGFSGGTWSYSSGHWTATFTKASATVGTYTITVTQGMWNCTPGTITSSVSGSSTQVATATLVNNSTSPTTGGLGYDRTIIT